MTPDMTTDCGCMIYIHNARLGGELDYPTGGTYVIKNNTGRFTGRHAYTMIQVPPRLGKRFAGSTPALVTVRAFRINETSSAYRNMIRFGDWDNERLTLREQPAERRSSFRGQVP